MLVSLSIFFKSILKFQLVLVFSSRIKRVLNGFRFVTATQRLI